VRFAALANYDADVSVEFVCDVVGQMKNSTRELAIFLFTYVVFSGPGFSCTMGTRYWLRLRNLACLIELAVMKTCVLVFTPYID